jgi:hypothetical protein
MAMSTIDDTGLSGTDYKKKAAPKKKAASPSRPSGTSSNNRYSPPSPAPSFGSGTVPSVASPSPRPQSVSQFLSGDDIYQQAVRGGKRTLQDFLSELTRKRGEAKTNFTQTQEQMETDRVRQMEQLRDSFASRGLIHSGLFGQEQGRFQEDFKRQLQQLL